MSRRQKKWLIITGSAIALFVIFISVLPEIVRSIALKQIAAATHRAVTIEDIDINLFTRRIAIKNFRLANRDRPDALVQFKELSTKFYYRPLFGKNLRLAELNLVAPSWGIARTGASEFNFSDLIPPPEKEEKEKKESGLTFTIDRFKLSDGTLVLDDQAVQPARSWKAEGLNFEIENLSTRKDGPAGRATINLTLAGTPISLNASDLHLTPQNGRAALKFEGFDLALLLPYVPADAPVTLKSGHLSAALTLNYGGQGAAQLDGDIRLKTIAVLQHGKPEPFLAAPELDIKLKDIQMKGGVFNITAVEVAGDPTVTDTSLTPANSFDLKQLKIAVQKLAWPQTEPATVKVTSQLPQGGAVDIGGTVLVKPVKADLKVILKDADLSAYQRYIPISAPLVGRADADLDVSATVEEGVQAAARGKASLSSVAIGTKGAPLVSVQQATATAIDVRWPEQIKVGQVRLRRPYAFIERKADGTLPLRAVFSPPGAKPEAKPAAPAATPVAAKTPVPAETKPPAKPAAGPKKPAIEIGDITVDEGNARFIDRTGEPPYSDELSRLAMNIKGLSNAPGKKAQLKLQSVIGATGALELHGDIAPLGDTLFVDLDGELRDFSIPRTNPYTARILSWIAKDGRLATKLHFRLDGDKLDAKSEIVVGRLNLVKAREDDQVKDKIGLPLGLIVALMKDSRGEIRVNVPVSGSLSSPQFSLSEAIWTAVKNVLVNILAAPFKLIGRMFTSGDKITGFSVDPIPFDPGSAAIGQKADAQLKQMAEFMRGSPGVRLGLSGVVSDPDIAALKTQEVTARIQRYQREQNIGDLNSAAQRFFRQRYANIKPPENVEGVVAVLRDIEPAPDEAAKRLATRRVEAVRDRLTSTGTDAQRLESEEKPPPPNVEGDGRVEFDILP
ncbi:MAG TPA: DUF748 domain-containing protein [Candidatus Binatia bacterium]|nr:DUF748 domain-containing protein [Candidatus Binatia bacterium]